VIDIIHVADVLAQLEQIADGGVEILRLQRAVVEVGGVVFFGKACCLT
jgi:hypothetical protein